MTTGTRRRWLVMRLEAPLVAFGGVAIDHIGVTWDFPALSAMTGLFANALGYDRTERQAHQELQDRLVFAARREREPIIGVLRDMQNVQGLGDEKRGWTTRGEPEERAGGSLDSIHRRQRDYHPDAAVVVVATLKDSVATPSLDDLADALDRPARPLFIGRKPCLPAFPLRHRFADGSSFIEAETAHAALGALADITASQSPRTQRDAVRLRALWPADEGPTSGALVDRAIAVADRRNWISGLHGGTRAVIEGRIALSEAAP
ncbi:MAG: type I-E CRISPR-associated protein Cas5/CasD [Hyphomicrobiaceae bacterium]